MPKIGPAFSDYVTSENISRRYHGGRRAHDFLSLIPFLSLILVISFLLIRLFYIQVLRGDYYKGLSEANRTRTTIIPAARGVIFDHLGRPLVRNSPAFKIVEKNKVHFINKDEALRLMSHGKDVENDITREYLYKDIFSHVLGYIGQISRDELLTPEFSSYNLTDFTGKMGLEKQYEGLLHGKNGKELYEVDARGNTMRFLGRQEPQAGRDITTTLDVTLQEAAALAMKDVKKGAVVVSDPRDGGIRALYSKPSFDPNLFTHPDTYKASGDFKTLSQVLSDTTVQPFLNRAISGTYPPGSTFKLVTAIAALESGAMRAGTIVDDTGILKVGAFSFGNWYFLQYGKTEGQVDIVKAIKRSNDIYFYKAAEGTGVETLASWAKKFGVGQKLGIDIPGEEGGLIPNEKWKKENWNENWYLGDTYHMGIGQGFLLTTPLQVNYWTSVFANDGELYRPHLLSGQKEVMLKNFMSSQNRELVREGMKQSCAPGGVAWPLFEFKVKNLPAGRQVDNLDYFADASGSAKMVRVVLGCKTGTAETDEKHNPHAWISVIAPFYHPEIVVTVLVENGGEGSSVAGPIAKKILEKYFERK